jgi:uncharacterized protein (DUF1501 family)
MAIEKLCDCSPCGAAGRPGLDSSHLYENRDLAVTTDFRDVFAEVLAKSMGIADLAPVFPDYSLDERKRLGVIVA